MSCLAYINLNLILIFAVFFNSIITIYIYIFWGKIYAGVLVERVRRVTGGKPQLE